MASVVELQSESGDSALVNLYGKPLNSENMSNFQLLLLEVFITKCFTDTLCRDSPAGCDGTVSTAFQHPGKFRLLRLFKSLY